MRALSSAVLISGVLAAPSAACDMHGGMFGFYEEMAAYQSAQAYEAAKAREALMLAEREKAMAEARQSFLARFDIKPEAVAQLASLSTPPQPLSSTDVDRSSQPDAQGR